jgi:glycosyltransferase involved in cell wall biosynthesis
MILNSNQKKTILHFIYSLGRGGAETMLVRALSDLKEYNNIVVTLYESNQFEKGIDCQKYICLHSPSILSLPLAVVKFKAVIKELKPDLVHSHLPLCNFIARLAIPKSIPLVTTIHTCIASAKDYKKWYIRVLDTFTYKLKKSTIIAVSNVALNDYFTVLKIKPYQTRLLIRYFLI